MVKTLELTMGTSLTALADQVDAANSDQARILTDMARRFGTAPQVELPPFGWVVLAKFAQRWAEGSVGFCDHLTPFAPQPAFWVPFAAGRIRCRACTRRTLARTKGTSKDRSCDRCAKWSRGGLHLFAMALPGSVVGMTAPAARPPVTVQFGLCPACVADQGLAETRSAQI